MNHKNRSILLQTALKVAGGMANSKTAADVVANTDLLYEGVVELAASKGIDLDAEFQTSRGGGGGSRKPSGGFNSTSGGNTNPDVPVRTINGVEYNDYVGLKTIGAVKPRHPDFKIGTKGFWILDPDGNPTEFAVENELV